MNYFLKELEFFLISMLRIPFVIFKRKRCKNNFFIRLYLSFRVKHLYGEKEIKISSDKEVLLICQVKNSDFLIKEFIEYHLGIGVKHIILVDNMSTDATIDIAKQYDSVTILQTRASYLKYQSNLRAYLIRKYAIEKWTLFLDVDEFFDVPFNDKISLRQFINYLDLKGYNAVHAYMAEVFANEDLSKVPNTSFSNFYDSFEVSGHHTKIEENKITPNSIYHLFSGGIRSTYFDKSTPISKYPLFKASKRIRPRELQNHLVDKCEGVADVSIVLRHYQFTYKLYEKSVEIAKKKNYAAYRKYIKFKEVLDQDKDHNLYVGAQYPIEYSYLNLVAYGIVKVSSDFYNHFKIKPISLKLMK